MSKSLQVLAENRDALLLAEVAAWLHMFGKLHEEFLCGRHDLATKIPEDVESDFRGLYNLLTTSWPGRVWATLPIPEFQAENLSIQDVIRYHQTSLQNLDKKKRGGFLKLLSDAHGRGSGTEKGVLDRFAPTQTTNVYLSTSLAYEADKPIDLAAIKTDRQLLYQFLYTQLDNLKNRNAKLSCDEWSRFQSTFVQRIEQSYSQTVADTRRPLNDVTLLDQTAVSVAFFKAALAQNLLLGKWKDPSAENLSDKYHWYLIRIGLDTLTFWGTSTRITDLLARKERVEKALDEVQLLLEVTYPLGNEVYRDENGSIFIVPDVDDLLSYTDGSETLEKRIQRIADDRFSGETGFTWSLSGRTRDTLRLGKLAVEAFPQPKPQVDWLKQQWTNLQRDRCPGDICPVCGLRPQGPGQKACDRKVCDTCEGRRVDRSSNWVESLSKTAPVEKPETVWLDEVADIYGRVALIVAQFDLTNWLSGDAFNSVMAIDPSEHELIVTQEKKDGSIEVVERHPFKLATFINDIDEGLKQEQGFLDNPISDFILPQGVKSEAKRKNLKGSRGFNTVRDVYAFAVFQTDLHTISSLSSSELLALALLRLWPSPARIYRVWRTTQQFWKAAVSNFQSEDCIGQVEQRLRLWLKPDQGTADLSLYHTYDLKLGDITLSVAKVADQEFVTVDNLQRTAILLNAAKEDRESYGKAVNYVKQLKELQVGKYISVEEPTGYGSPNKPLGKLQISDEVIAEQTPYIPTITILTEPRTFMALVPANKALNVAEAIRAKYEQEMSKVRNRLPLTMGIVFAGRRTPFPAILDAGRRMLRQPTKSEVWEVEKIDSADDDVTLKLKREERSLSVNVRTKMGNGKTKDVWYPYWCVERDKDGPIKPFSRTRQFTGIDIFAEGDKSTKIDKKEWVPVCDLQIDDEVRLVPSRFDFEFLDTAARRFEVSYESDKRRESIHPCRPYYLELLEDLDKLWKILSKGLVTSQIHNLIALIEAKRMEWSTDQDKSIFERMVCDILANANWNPRPDRDEFEYLQHAAISGQLADVVELYMRILKEKPDSDQEEGNQ